MGRKYKIVHVISNLDLGGAQILLFDILNHLKSKSDLDISVITIDSGYFVNKFVKSGIKVYDLKKKGLVNPGIFFKMTNLIKEINPDIIHTHLNKADFYGRIAAKYCRVPLIFSTCHNYSTTHSGADINKKSVFDRIDDLVIKFSGSYLIAISELVKKYLINRNPDFEKITELIYNGLNTEKEKYLLNASDKKIFRKENNIAESDFVIMISGRLEKQKGHLFFLESLKDLIKSKPEIKIIILGEGSLRSEIENCIKDNSLTDQVRLMGFREDTEKFTEISDLICVPSLWEGFGLVIIEGMIKGKLVLASNTGGVPEIIEHGKNGFLFEKLNKNDLKEKFNYIINERNNFPELRLNAIETVKTKFDIQKNSEIYYNSYLSKLNNNGTNY